MGDAKGQAQRGVVFPILNRVDRLTRHIKATR